MVKTFISEREGKLLSNQKKDKEREEVQERIFKLQQEVDLVLAEYVLLTISHAAEARDVSRAAITDLVKRGRIRAVEAFGTIRVFYDDLENLTPQKPGPKRGSKKSGRAKASDIDNVNNK